ncbi:hypothetical protein [Cerasicoccus frondis]|uniref:hypothetical protein n=1 Tax=Cerasicoccus frondis TaxID=490090 RepID=UPI002852D6B6|nr:hypothetical protein [Cerasicoccus frondis]
MSKKKPNLSILMDTPAAETSGIQPQKKDVPESNVGKKAPAAKKKIVAKVESTIKRRRSVDFDSLMEQDIERLEIELMQRRLKPFNEQGMIEFALALALNSSESIESVYDRIKNKDGTRR